MCWVFTDSAHQSEVLYAIVTQFGQFDASLTPITFKGISWLIGGVQLEHLMFDLITAKTKVGRAKKGKHSLPQRFLLNFAPHLTPPPRLTNHFNYFFDWPSEPKLINDMEVGTVINLIKCIPKQQESRECKNTYNWFLNPKFTLSPPLRLTRKFK